MITSFASDNPAGILKNTKESSVQFSDPIPSFPTHFHFAYFVLSFRWNMYFCWDQFYYSTTGAIVKLKVLLNELIKILILAFLAGNVEQVMFIKMKRSHLRLDIQIIAFQCFPLADLKPVLALWTCLFNFLYCCTSCV